MPDEYNIFELISRTKDKKEEIKDQTKLIIDNSGVDLSAGAAAARNSDTFLTEKLRQFLGGYMKEDANYIVDGAKIVCSNMVEDLSDITIEVADICPEAENTTPISCSMPVEEEEVRRFHAVTVNADANGLVNGTVDDVVTKFALENGEVPANSGVSIHSLGHCKKVLERLNMEQLELIKSNKTEVDKYGTCYCLMNLESQWENPPCIEQVVEDYTNIYQHENLINPPISSNLMNLAKPVRNPQEFLPSYHSLHSIIHQRRVFDFEGREGLTMLSTMYCKSMKGFITFITSGQIMHIMNSNGREVILPDEIYITINGVMSVYNPYKQWGGIGYGAYPKGVRKDSQGRYYIAVGPRVLDPDYPDDGKIWGSDFDSHSKRVDVILKDKNGNLKTIECVVEDIKSHSYNKYPDGHAYHTGDFATASVNGVVQTGISYPNSSNAAKNMSFSAAHSNATAIEFCGHALDFNISDYEMVSLIVVE